MTSVTELSARIDAPIRKARLTDNAVLIRIQLASYGTTRKIESSQVRVGDSDEPTGEVDKTLIRTTKKILDSEEADDIRKLDGEIRQYVYSTCLPSNIWDGLYFVPMISVERVNAKLREFSNQRAVLVEILCDSYESIVARDRARLGSVWKATDYPSQTQIRAAYQMSWTYIALTAPRSLESISEELYMNEKQKVEKNVAEAAEAIQCVLRSQFSELVTWLSERLTPNPDGTKKRFKETALVSFQEFLSEFRNRNVVDDYQLQQLVDRAKAIVGGISVESLRSKDDLREKVRESFDEIKSQLGSMVYTPRRKFDI